MAARNLGLTEIFAKMGSDPGSPVEGQEWYRTDTHKLFVRNESASIEVLQSVSGFTSGTVTVATSITTVVSLSLPVGTWALRGTYQVANNAANIFTGTLAMTSGTLSANNSIVSFIGAAGGTCKAATAGSAVATGATSDTYTLYVSGTVVCSVAGTLAFRGTAASSSKTAAAGAFMIAERLV